MLFRCLKIPPSCFVLFFIMDSVMANENSHGAGVVLGSSANPAKLIIDTDPGIGEFLLFLSFFFLNINKTSKKNLAFVECSCDCIVIVGKLV